MDDPSWIRNCELLTRGLQSLDRSISAIRRSTNKVCTLKDIAVQREQVTKVTSAANSKDVQSIQDALQLLEKYIRLHPAQLSSQGAKLTMDAQTTLENYQQACSAFYKKCISVEEMYRNTQGGSTPSSTVSQNRKARGGVAVAVAGSDDDADETQNLLGGGGSKNSRGGGAGTTQVQTLEDQRADFERDLHEEIMAERNREARDIAENVRDIKEIFQHIHEIVGEQGVQLDVVEQNVNRAEGSTRNATEQLRMAQKYQEDSQRNKMCLAFVMVVVFLVVVVLLFS